MKLALSSLLVAFLFSLGLGLSGMTEPNKVLGFLDIFGNWDPSLLFVMAGAIGVHAIAYAIAKKRPSPLLKSSSWQIPSKKELTPALIIGAVLFGAGWGLAGYCPGPAITSAASLSGSSLLFVGSMLIGMLIFKFIDRRTTIRR